MDALLTSVLTLVLCLLLLVIVFVLKFKEREHRLKLTPAMLSILSTKRGLQYLETIKPTVLMKAHRVTIDNGYLVITALGRDLGAINVKLKAIFDCRTSVDSNVTLPNDLLPLIKAKLEETRLVTVSWKESKQLQITGIKEDILPSKIDARQPITEYEACIARKNILASVLRERRGTLEFMKKALKLNSFVPYDWCYDATFVENMEMHFDVSDLTTRFLPVDQETFKAVSYLIDKIWSQRLVGLGRDAADLDHRRIKVLEIKRVENLSLFEDYHSQIKKLLKKMCKLGRSVVNISQIPKSRGDVKTTALLSGSMKERLHHEVNEHLLFHGTSVDNIRTIVTHGFDPKLSHPQSMFGKGIYLSENPVKADQYTDSWDNRSSQGAKLTMILARTLLGNVYLSPKPPYGESGKLIRPPCMSCFKDTCQCQDQILFDSVMGDGRNMLHREFVVYDTDRCYPEYVITYERE